MNPTPSLWSHHAAEPRLLSQVLLCLHEDQQAETHIEYAIALAKHCRSRVRGLTLFDSTAFDEQVRASESAAPVILEMSRLMKLEERFRELRGTFSRACLAADLDFDLRQERGVPREILLAQARSMDLVLLGLPTRRSWFGRGLATAEVIDLVLHGVQPLMILRDSAELPQRVLLVHDGNPASDRAIRQFAQQSLFPQAEMRLLTVADRSEQAQELLHQLLETLQARWPQLEHGCAAGKPQSVVPDYIEHWNADLVVLGVPRSPILTRALYGETIHNVLKHSGCAVYATS